MAGFTNYTEDALLDHLLGTAEYTQPTIYVGLFTAAPNDDGGGTEVSGGNYARVEVSAWDAAVDGATANTGAITFTKATDAWGTVSHFGLFDAASAGNLLAWCAATAEKPVASGDTYVIEAGALDITLD